MTRAVGAVVAHFPDTEGVTSSNLVSPTLFLLLICSAFGRFFGVIGRNVCLVVWSFGCHSTRVWESFRSMPVSCRMGMPDVSCMSCGLLSHALPVGVLELLAGDGVPGGPCVGLGMFGVLAPPPADRLQLSRWRAFHDSMRLFVDGAGPPAAEPPSLSRAGAAAIRRSRLPVSKVPAPTFNPATHQSAQDVTAYPGHTFWPITRFYRASLPPLAG